MPVLYRPVWRSGCDNQGQDCGKYGRIFTGKKVSRNTCNEREYSVFVLFQVVSLCILCQLISTATPSYYDNKKISGSLGQLTHRRLARSPQTFGNSFDPIPVDQVRDHFAAGDFFIDVAATDIIDVVVACGII